MNLGLYRPELASQVLSLVVAGQHKKALRFTEEFKGSTSDEQLETYLAKSCVLNEIWETSKIQWDAQLWELAGKTHNPILAIDTYLCSLETSIRRRDKKTTINFLEQGDTFFRNVDALEDKHQAYYHSKFALLFGLAHLMVLGQRAQSLKYFIDSREGFDSLNSKQGHLGVVQSLFWTGYAHFKGDKYVKAIEHFHSSLAKAEEVNNVFWQARNSHYLGKAHLKIEEWSIAEKYLRSTVLLYQPLDLPSFQSGALLDLISTLLQVKAWEKLRGYLQERIQLAEENNLTSDKITSLYWLAYYHEYRKEVLEAIEVYQELLGFLTSLGFSDEIHRCSAHLSYLRAQVDDILPEPDWQAELEMSDLPWRIVFVCNGNMSRSPYSDLYAQKWLEDNHPNLIDKIKIDSIGILYHNIEMSPLTRKFLLKDGVDREKVEKFRPRYWEDFMNVCEEATLLVTMTGEQSNLLNFHFPGKAVQISYCAYEIHENVIDPAIHQTDALELFERLKNLTATFMTKLVSLIRE